MIVADAKGILRYHVACKSRIGIEHIEDATTVLVLDDVSAQQLELPANHGLEIDDGSFREHGVEGRATVMMHVVAGGREDRGAAPEPPGAIFILVETPRARVELVVVVGVLDVELVGINAHDGPWRLAVSADAAPGGGSGDLRGGTHRTSCAAPGCGS